MAVDNRRLPAGPSQVQKNQCWTNINIPLCPLPPSPCTCLCRTEKSFPTFLARSSCEGECQVLLSIPVCWQPWQTNSFSWGCHDMEVMGIWITVVENTSLRADAAYRLAEASLGHPSSLPFTAWGSLKYPVNLRTVSRRGQGDHLSHVCSNVKPQEHKQSKWWSLRSD